MRNKCIQNLSGIEEDDLILGEDNEWHSIVLTSITKKRMYNFITESGMVVCPYDHFWVLYKDNKEIIASTIAICNHSYLYRDANVGTPDGPIFIKVEQSSSEQFEDGDSYQDCIYVEIDGSRQFEILTDIGEREFTYSGWVYLGSSLYCKRK